MEVEKNGKTCPPNQSNTTGSIALPVSFLTTPTVRLAPSLS